MPAVAAPDQANRPAMTAAMLRSPRFTDGLRSGRAARHESLKAASCSVHRMWISASQCSTASKPSKLQAVQAHPRVMLRLIFSDESAGLQHTQMTTQRGRAHRQRFAPHAAHHLLPLCLAHRRAALSDLVGNGLNGIDRRGRPHHQGSEERQRSTSIAFSSAGHAGLAFPRVLPRQASRSTPSALGNRGRPSMRPVEQRPFCWQLDRAVGHSVLIR